jgi:ABC-type transporter Mla subunit MlaD
VIANSTANTQLCPSCANSIAEDASDCPYCKAKLSTEFAPRWLKRDESAAEPRTVGGVSQKFPISARFIWPSVVVCAALIAFLAGRYMQGSELSRSAQTHLKQLQSKDQIIQSQETQLAQTRQQLKESTTQLTGLQAKLDVSQKALSLAQQRLGAATREVGRLSATRARASGRILARVPDRTAPLPPTVATTRTVQTGVYETTRATSVHQDPSSTSRVISQIGGGTRINVVSAAGGWLEVRSRRGNPPGYVRADDARPISGAS